MLVRNNIELEYATLSGLYTLPTTGHGDALNFLHIQGSPSTGSPTRHLQAPDCVGLSNKEHH